MPKSRTINIVIFGIGNVGSTLIRQINEVKHELFERQNLHLRIPIVTNSKLAFYDKDGVSNSWECDFEKFSVPYKIEEIIKFTQRFKYENLVAIDTTASHNFVENYISLVQNGFHIVSANKIANTLSYGFYNDLREVLKKHNKLFHYETNVGAGLPVIDTVKNLVDSGEKIHKIRGVFSGSLSYIFNSFSSEDVRFSEVLTQATRLGLTEPDAREDLSGNDVARKLLILARELNIVTEFSDVLIETLVPKQLNGKTTVQQFKSRSKELDSPFEKLKKQLPKEKVLRYVGDLDVIKQKLEVKLIAEEKTTPIGRLKGTDSVFEIFTESYGSNPLVIQGAGAGKEVTARGVLTDIIKLSNKLN